jgi:hypothetical protein
LDGNQSTVAPPPPPVVRTLAPRGRGEWPRCASLAGAVPRKQAALSRAKQTQHVFDELTLSSWPSIPCLLPALRLWRFLGGSGSGRQALLLSWQPGQSQQQPQPQPHTQRRRGCDPLEASWRCVSLSAPLHFATGKCSLPESAAASQPGSAKHATRRRAGGGRGTACLWHTLRAYSCPVAATEQQTDVRGALLCGCDSCTDLPTRTSLFLSLSLSLSLSPVPVVCLA